MSEYINLVMSDIGVVGCGDRVERESEGSRVGFSAQETMQGEEC